MAKKLWWRWSRRDPQRMLDRIRPHLIERYRSFGVTWVDFLVAYHESDGWSVWLCTTTDEERDRLGIEDPLLEDLLQMFLDAGFTAEQLENVSSTAQSQETVDRVFQGNWWAAMR